MIRWKYPAVLKNRTYELIRRRLKRIVLADCGADPQYNFKDLANLVLKVRIDFGVEIQIFSAEDLDDSTVVPAVVRELFADPASFDSRRGPPLLLALVRYPNDAIPGWMVIVKPRLPAHLPVDLARYAEREVDFPQQTTVDQFYDEAQWESTHKLGCIVGAQLAQVLSVLPAWLPGATPAPTHFRGAPLVTRLPEVAEAASSETRSGGQSSLIKVYAPLFIALWTGFEFYSNYKRDQEKDLVDATKFVLSRLDNLERQVFSPGGCSSKTASADDCSTIPMQAAYIRRILVELPSASAKPLLEITDRIEATLNLGRPHETNLAGSAEASATATAQLDQTGEPDPTPTSPPSVAQDALIYVQIYDEKRRASADGMVQALREAGFSAHQLPGVENVTKTARAKEMEPPIPFKAPTVVYFSDGDRPLADWLVQRLTYRKEGRAVSLNLSKQYPHVKRGLVEIWLP